ncbi:MAG: LPS assembly lipoprotein LptE [Akkermansia sp.]|nr:LPS assembly lipoprotein LptE [Akkermansia sp.]
MKRLFQLSLCALPLVLGSCGYQLGGLVNGQLEGMKTFNINMFDNHTTFPNVAMQVTSALGNAMQTDGTFTVASPSEADFSVSGAVTSVNYNRLLVDSADSYLSLEIGVVVSATYTVTDNKTGKVIKSGSVSETGSYFNAGGNTLAGRDAALSYAARKAAGAVVDQLTTP